MQLYGPAATRSIAPNRAPRIEQIGEGNKLNDLIAPWGKQTPRLTFIDTRNLTLGTD